MIPIAGRLLISSFIYLKGFSINPFQMNNFYGLVAGSAAAAPGVPSANARYIAYLQRLS